MENLVSKSITYQGLRHVFNNKDNLIQQTIDNIKNKSMRDRLTKEAKEFWAKKFKTTPDKIHYGDLNVWNEKYIPEYVIGIISIYAKKLDMSNLKGVIGGIRSDYIKEFLNLEFADELSISYSGYNQKDVNLPKLKKCKYLSIYSNKIKNLALEVVDIAHITYCEIEKINIKKAKELVLDGTKIKDISSLEEVDFLEVVGIPKKTLIINPELKIKNAYSCAKFYDDIIKL